jgi:hypothetical protein
LPKPHKPRLKPKLYQRACKANAEKEKKIKHENTTMAIRNAGFSGNLKVLTINKIYGRLKGL